MSEVLSYIFRRKYKTLISSAQEAEEEDIAICTCKVDPNNLESSCGERCLNILTSTEWNPVGLNFNTL